MDDTTKPKKKRVSGWLSIKDPQDLEKALVRMLNKILASSNPLEHAGRFANLANAWTNARKLRLDSEDLNAIKERLDELEAGKK